MFLGSRFSLCSSSALEKRHRPDLNAFARMRVGRRGRIDEGSMRGPAGAAVLFGIEHFEHIGFLAPHAREPIPFVRRIEFDGVGLADAAGRAALRDDHVARCQRLGVGHRERKGLDRKPDRPPHLDDGEAPL